MRGLPGQGGVVSTPVVTSARFENGVTTVTGRLGPPASSTSFYLQVLLFAGTGDTQALVATREINDGSGEFTIAIPRDLRGHAVRAVTYQTYVYNWDDGATGRSEMSGARVVE